MPEANKPPGWDAKAISGIANDRFGSFPNMFSFFGWPERGAEMIPAVQKRVAESFGTVQKFVDVYQGREAMPPLEAIESDPPNVWLTNAWGFEPDKWGCITFPNDSALKSFLRRSEPGCLVVIYDTGWRNPSLRGKVRGVIRSTHEIAHTRDLLTADAWREKQDDPEMRDRWPVAAKIDGAWAITPEAQPDISEFANETYTPGRGRVIGGQGMPLTSAEARKLLKLDFFEVNIARTTPMFGSAPTSGLETFGPSRAGPVSQRPHSCRESEGPKHIYFLQLSGDSSTFLGRDVSDQQVYKVGMSRSPESRCSGLNSSFPEGVFRWSVCKSTFAEGKTPYPTSKAAIEVEDKLKAMLADSGTSLGGEFFLASEKTVELAWKNAVDGEVR